MLVNNRFLPYLYTMMENKRYQLDDGFCVCEYRGNCQEALTGYAHLPHQLQKNAVLICLQGEITIGMNLHDCGLRKLDMTFIPEKTIIESFSCSADAQCLICLFNKGYYEDDSIDNTLIRQQFLITPSYHIQDDAIEEILTLFRLIERKIEEPDNLYKKKAVKGYIQVLMSLGYNSMRQSSALSSQAHASRSQEVFQQFLLLAHQHYRKEQLSVHFCRLCILKRKMYSECNMKTMNKIMLRVMTVALIGGAIILVVGCKETNGQENNGPKEVKSTELIRTSQSWDGVDLPDYLQGRPELVAVKYEFPAGQKLGWHHHPVMNYGILVQGELTIIGQDGKEKVVHEGEAVVEMVNTIHHGENRGDKPVILYMFYLSQDGLPLAVQHPEIPLD